MKKRRDRKLGPVSLKSFIAWLETKPADEKYEYCDWERCALGQYMKAQGKLGRECEVDLGFDSSEYIRDWQVQLKAIVRDGNRTFGAALERAQAALG